MVFPKTPAKINARIKRYERELRKDLERFGAIDDGAGKRFLLGPLYMLLNDHSGALKSFAWLQKHCPDDSGEPAQYLCWSLALHRSNKFSEAAQKLRQTMFQNLYIIPHLIERACPRYDMWHSSNFEEPDYIDYLAPETFSIWNSHEKQWAQDCYESGEFLSLRARYIEIYQELQQTSDRDKRSKLVQEAGEIAWG